MKNKIIKNNDAKAIIKYVDNINIKDKIKLDNLINEYYINDDCDYILQIDTNNYKGDLICLCDMGEDLINIIKKYNLINKIKEFYAYKDYSENGIKKKLYENILKEYA